MPDDLAEWQPAPARTTPTRSSSIPPFLSIDISGLQLSCDAFLFVFHSAKDAALRYLCIGLQLNNLRFIRATYGHNHKIIMEKIIEANEYINKQINKTIKI